MSVKAKHSKNAGLTLVELLVACTMLAIIVVPLLHSFVSSARLGLKARRSLRITTAAQDIMEGLKAESIESLSCSFNYPDDDIAGAAANPGTPVERHENAFKNFHLVSSDLVGNIVSANLYELRATVVEDKSSDDYRSVTGMKNISGRTNTHMDDFGSKDSAKADLAASTKTVTDELDRIVDYDFYGKSDKKYYFAIRDLQIEGDSDPNFKVDALIELDGSNYTSLGEDPKESVDGSGLQLLNEHGRISYSAFNEKRDAFFIQKDTLGLQTAQEFNIKYTPSPAECTEKDLCRKYIITMTNRTMAEGTKAADGNDCITVTCQVIYTTSPASGFLIPDTHADYVAADPDNTYKKTYEYTIFDNKATGYMPDNIFFCYYPGYGAPAADQIVYVNADSVPTVLHIIKQEGKNNATLNTDEIHYKCEVKINEGLNATADTKGTGAREQSVTPLRTNLDTNLFKVYQASAPDCSTQGTYMYNDMVLSRTLYTPKEIGIYPLGGEQMTSDSMYDVTIDIYEEGTLDAALLGVSGADPTGTVDNDKILFTLKGSMN